MVTECQIAGNRSTGICDGDTFAVTGFFLKDHLD